MTGELVKKVIRNGGSGELVKKVIRNGEQYDKYS